MFLKTYLMFKNVPELTNKIEHIKEYLKTIKFQVFGLLEVSLLLTRVGETYPSQYILFKQDFFDAIKHSTV